MKAIGMIAFLCVILLTGCNKEKGNRISLNGEWQIAETQEEDAMPETFESKINVPSLVDRAVPAFKKIEFGKDTARYFWYKKELTLDHSNYEVVELEIKKAKYSASVFVNGTFVHTHHFAFSSARINIKDFLKKGAEPNEVIIRIGTKENFPDTLICGDDFEKKKFFPGIFDDVNILLKNAPFIENVQVAPNINDSKIRALVEVKQLHKTEGIDLDYAIKEKSTGAIVAKGTHHITTDAKPIQVADFEVDLADFTPWSPENPFLYELHLETDADASSTVFGMRTFYIDTLTNRCMLNNKPYYLRGTNVALYRFFEDELRGELPWDKEWVRKLFTKFKSLNWNSLRFHVGPAPQFWYELADEMGILIQDEYSVWYGKPGFAGRNKPITVKSLASEYIPWMRERWNHPCIVIWDAQNETVTDTTGLALETVRHLDLSNRPWENGWSAPTRRSDIVESHPYLFFKIRKEDADIPKEGVLKFLLGEVLLPSNDANGHDPTPDGTRYGNANIINEYGWLWVNRDGSPTKLSEGIYKNLYRDVKTPEERLELYSRLIATLTEYWRAHQKAAGIQYFAGLTYSRPGEPKGQTSDCFKDIEKLELHESFEKYVKSAFSPVGLMVELWDKSYRANKPLNVPVYLINDLGDAWSGQAKLSLYKDDQLVSETVVKVEAAAYDVNRHQFTIDLPKKAGKYVLRTSIDFNGTDVSSYRDLNLK